MSPVARFSAALATMLAAASAGAQVLTDPTRPPAYVEPGGAPQQGARTQLQSVLIATGRRIAVINGSAVPLGGTVGDARVVKITESEVVLRRGEETEVLKMFPGVDLQRVGRGKSGAHGAVREETSRKGRSTR
jgi:MSHA biogenesis protein MshK